MTDPFEALAQRVAERVLDLIVSALDVKAPRAGRAAALAERPGEAMSAGTRAAA